MLFTINSLWNVIGKFRSKEQKTYVGKHESKESWNGYRCKWHKVDSRARETTRNKQGNHIMMKGSINEDDIAILSRYAPTDRDSKSVMVKLVKLKVDFHSILFIIDRISR